MPLGEAEEGLDRDGEDEIREEEGAEEEDRQLACMKTYNMYAGREILERLVWQEKEK
jgi:hypothetical protein